MILGETESRLGQLQVLLVGVPAAHQVPLSHQLLHKRPCNFSGRIIKYLVQKKNPSKFLDKQEFDCVNPSNVFAKGVTALAPVLEFYLKTGVCLVYACSGCGGSSGARKSQFALTTN